MNLDYKILWYEDENTFVDSIKEEIEDIIKKLYLKPKIKHLSRAEVDMKDIQKERYDLIIVDYNLKDKDNTGDIIISKIREGEIFTDVIFYSANREALNGDLLVKKKLDGVFFSEKTTEQLMEKIEFLIKKSMKKAEDLVNLRGIVMDNTSEFDTQIKEITMKSWKLLSDDNKLIIDTYIKEELLKKSFKDSKKRYDKYLSEENMIIYDVLEERMFDSSKKARLLNKIMSLNEECCKELNNIFKRLSGCKQNFYENYNEEIIWYRNILAHAKRNENDNDIYIGKSDGKFIIFDEKLCEKIRKNLIKYYNVFENLYGYIEEK